MKEKDFIIEKDGKQFVDVVRLLPDALPSGKKILWRRIDDEKIEISVDRHSARGGNARTIIIKRFVFINEDLFELFGMWLGDGIRKQWGVENAFGFSNTNVPLIREFLRVSEKCIGLSSTEFNCIISLTPEMMPNRQFLEKSVSNLLDIPTERFWNSRINPTRNFLGIDVKISSRLLNLVVSSMLNQLRTLAFQNRPFAAKVLQGIIASEANISVRKNGVLSDIMIAAKGEDKRNFIRQLLFSVDVQPNKDKTIPDQEGVCINGLSNFRKMDEWDLVSLQCVKFSEFKRGLQGFKKEEFRKGEGKLLILQKLKEKPKRSAELSKELNRTQSAINWTMNKLQKKGLVENLRKGKNIFWGLTNTGVNLIKNQVTIKELSVN